MRSSTAADNVLLRIVPAFHGVLNQSVLFAMLAPAMNVLFGPLILFAIAACLTPVLQGYYFTFGSIVSAQVFLELGLSQVIVQFASHEWSRLSIDPEGQVNGDPNAKSRLASLYRFGLRWYSVVAVIAAIALSAAGFLFFAHSPGLDVRWHAPWFFLCAFTAANIALLPIWAVLEGCHQIEQVYRFRFLSATVQNTSTLLALFLGCQLWTGGIAAAATFFTGAGTLVFKHRRFLATIASLPAHDRIEWRRELMPMQWRIGLSWLSGYFIFSLFTPVLFHYRGPETAGRMGMTWAIVITLSAISSAWIAPKAAQYGLLVARGEFTSLDRLALKSGIASVAMMSAASLALYLCLAVLTRFDVRIVDRFLPLAPTAIFLAAQALMQISHAQASYLRAFKQDPFVWVSVSSAVAIALSACILGKFYGAMGVAAAYLCSTALVSLPVGTWILHRCRLQWCVPNRRAV